MGVWTQIQALMLVASALLTEQNLNSNECFAELGPNPGYGRARQELHPATVHSALKFLNGGSATILVPPPPHENNVAGGRLKRPTPLFICVALTHHTHQ